MRVWTILLLLLTLTAPAATRTNRFEPDIRAFEAADKTNQPPTGATLFIGSSSIRLWTNMVNDLSDYAVINRGFGGSQIADSVHFVERVVLPYKPSVIVMYAGGNDINDKKTPQTVLDDFKQFVRRVHETLPGTKIAYISIAPNPARWAQVEQVREANRLIEQFTQSDPRLSFIDVFPHMLGSNGEPRPEIFSADRLHMNPTGYVLWTQLVRQHLARLNAPKRTPAAPRPNG